MLMLETFHRLFLAAACLCVRGTPVPSFTPTQDSQCDGPCVSVVTPAGSTPDAAVKSKPSDEPVFGSQGLTTGLTWNIGAEGGADPNGRKMRPKGIHLVTQTETGIGDSRDARSGTSEAGGEVWNRRSEGKAEAAVGGRSEVADAQRQPEEASVLSADSFTDEPIPTLTGDQVMTQRLTLREFSGSSPAPSQLKSSSEVQEPPEETQKGNQEGDGQTTPPDGEGSDPKTSRTPPLTEPSVRIQRLTSLGAMPPSSFSTALSTWGHESVTASTLPESLLPEIGPNLMPREDGPENLWTEAARSSSVDTVIPLSQDEATEGTMSSEALPLIFEPFDEITSEGAAAPAVAQAPGSAQPPAAMATGGMPLSEVDLDQLVTVETDSDGPSRAPPMLIPDWTSTWQTSGAELLEPISPSGLSVSQRRAGTNPEGVVRTPNVEADLTTTGTLSSSQRAMTTTDQTHRHSAHKSRSGFMEAESDEEPDEDEEDENSEESLEEESEEDLTETPKPSSTQPPYSLIPPPPVWVQRNQGLMRSWVELIKEKAGYVSGMLAPVGIGITGALLIVGALYSIRMIHRKRRNSFKHQRRKVRQPEQPREPGVNRQDQAMLLADSSEDEF